MEKTYLRFPHKIGIYTKATTTNSAGQRVTTFTFDSDIKAGPFEIINIDKKMGFNGKVNHILLTARKVVEGA